MKGQGCKTGHIKGRVIAGQEERVNEEGREG
jgi:hypothetical protein